MINKDMIDIYLNSCDEYCDKKIYDLTKEYIKNDPNYIYLLHQKIDEITKTYLNEDWYKCVKDNNGEIKSITILSYMSLPTEKELVKSYNNKHEKITFEGYIYNRNSSPRLKQYKKERSIEILKRDIRELKAILHLIIKTHTKENELIRYDKSWEYLEFYYLETFPIRDILIEREKERQKYYEFESKYKNKTIEIKKDEDFDILIKEYNEALESI